MAKSKKKPAPKKASVKKTVAKAKKKPAKVAKPAGKAKPAKKAATKAAPKKVVVKAVAKPAPKKSLSKSKQEDKPANIPVRPTAQNLQLKVLPVVNQRPIAHKAKHKSAEDEGKTKYSDEELKEFETLINKKLEKARDEFRILRETLNRNNDEGTDSTSGGNTKVLEDGAETAEKENLGQQAARQLKYITNLENALVRIKNGTYGICSVTGKLISKERLIAVPHTTQSIEAKMLQKD
jgi:RNA polymerase-binding transcription factor DksA